LRVGEFNSWISLSLIVQQILCLFLEMNEGARGDLQAFEILIGGFKQVPEILPSAPQRP
jgi:hypothetical protein